MVSASTLWANGYQQLDVTNCPPVTSEGQIAVIGSPYAWDPYHTVA